MFSKCSTESEAKTLFRSLAKRLHPDHGGSAILMKHLKEAYDEFINVISCLDEAQESQQQQSQQQKKRRKSNPVYECNKYERVYEDLELGDERLELLDDMYKYAREHSKFDTSFINSINAFLEEKEYITEGQYNALLNTYKAFRMGEQKENDGN